MAAPETEQFTIVCRDCRRPMKARRAWEGRDVQCPYCSSVVRVPAPPSESRAVQAGRPVLGPKLEFNFGCPRCQTLLESHTGLSGQPGRCPACGARVVVPEVNRRTGRPRRAQLLDDGGEDPTPIHAYAASGLQAPRIFRRADGTQVIECPRCSETCPVDAESCPACGTPFTADAAPSIPSYKSTHRAQIALVLGLVSLPLCMLFVPALAAIAFGALSLRLGAGRHPPVAGIVGIALGVISLAGGLALLLI
jgi:DNA-directed RNA polymerase subunit RPC12/RpoP